MNAKYMAEGMGHGGTLGDRGELASHLDQFAEDTRFLESIRPELQNKYPNCWVAVYQKQVVGTGTTLKEVIQKLDENDIPKSRAVIDFLRSEPIAMIL